MKAPETLTEGGEGYDRETRQPARLVAGHCPECGLVVAVENHRETWPLVRCRCGWAGATDEVRNYVRLEQGAVRLVDDQRGPPAGPLSDCLFCARSCERCGYPIAGGFEHVAVPQAEGAGHVVCLTERVKRPLAEILDVYLTHAHAHATPRSPGAVTVEVNPDLL